VANWGRYATDTISPQASGAAGRRCRHVIKGRGRGAPGVDTLTGDCSDAIGSAPRSCQIRNPANLELLPDDRHRRCL
jgi:hypothetical protein